jgi:UDP-N-acetylmuramate dehydrogenase
MNLHVLADKLEKKVDCQVFVHASMRNFTTWRVGGPADLLITPHNKEDIKNSILFAKEYGLPITVIGNGSNLLVLDGGIRGLVIKLGEFKGVSLQGEMITVEAGVMIPVLARMATKASLSGLEFAVGIPATLGGGLVMNAGAFGQSIGSLVQEIEAIDYQGKEQSLSKGELSFCYRSSSISGQELVVLRAVLRLIPAPKEDIASRMEINKAERAKIQPIGLPCAGSVFRNPPQDYAGKLIEELGLKGQRIGDAEVSSKHANFIVNCGCATGREILTLIKIIQERVFENKGIMLVPEVLIIGEEG